MRRIHYAWVVAGLTFLVLVVAAGMRAAPTVMLLPLQQEFGWSKGAIGAAVGLNLLLYGLFGPFAVAVMDRWGMRRTLLASLALIVAGIGLTPVMHASWQFVLLWGVMGGLGSGVVSMVLAATVAARWFAARRGMVVGVLTASAAAGQMVFLPLLAWLVTHGGWRAMVLMLAGMVAALLPLVAWGMRNRPFDMGLAPYGDPGPPAPPPAGVGKPVVNALRALHGGLADRDFLLLAGSFFVCGATTNGLIGTHLVPACVDAGISPVAGASLVAGMGVFNLVGALGSGWLSDRVDSRKLLGVYYLLRGLALLYLPYSFDSAAGLSVFALLYGLDWIATVPPTVKLATQCFGKERAGLMYGWISAAHQVGSGLAAFMGGAMRDSLGSYFGAFLLAGMMCLVAVAMALLVGRRAVPVLAA
jgi:sugar phosphate permease